MTVLWQVITCKERDELFLQLDGDDRRLLVLASSTDPDYYIFTEWGERATERPVLRDYRWPNGLHSCKHEVPGTTALSPIRSDHDESSQE